MALRPRTTSIYEHPVDASTHSITFSRRPANMSPRTKLVQTLLCLTSLLSSFILYFYILNIAEAGIKTAVAPPTPGYSAMVNRFLVEPTPDSFFAVSLLYMFSTALLYRQHQRDQRQSNTHTTGDAIVWLVGMLAGVFFVVGDTLDRCIAYVPLMVSSLLINSVAGYFAGFFMIMVPIHVLYIIASMLEWK